MSFLVHVLYNTKMEQKNCENNAISYKESLIKSIIKDFREIITQYGFKYRTRLLKNLKKHLDKMKKQLMMKMKMIMSIYKVLLTD